MKVTKNVDYTNLSYRDFCTVKMCTAETRLRHMRAKMLHGFQPVTSPNSFGDGSSSDDAETDSELLMQLDLREIDGITMLSLSVLDQKAIEYRVENRSMTHTIHYRQHGVSGYRWHSLEPCSSAPYVWDDPFKPHRLVVRVGNNLLSLSNSPSSFLSLNNVDIGMAVVEFDEFDFFCPLYLPNQGGQRSSLCIKVGSEGLTKVLKVLPVSMNKFFLLITQSYEIFFFVLIYMYWV
jgi:hypothetical protein